MTIISRGDLISLIQSRLLHNKLFFSLALNLDKTINEYFFWYNGDLKKDLYRTSPSLCPACNSPDVHHYCTLPYYKTFLKFWNSSLDDYYTIVKAPYAFSKFNLCYCKSCELIFVSESYKNLVENVENHPLYFKLIKSYIDECQILIDDNYVNKIINNNSTSEIEKRFMTNYSIIKSYATKIHSFLDLGSGMGSFAEFIRISLPQLNVSCCDINTYYINECKNRYPNLNCIVGPLSPYDASKKFDFIYLTDVIEHIWDLDNFIRTIKAHLTDNGYAMIITPNLDCIEAKKSGVNWWPYIVPHHSQIFNSKSLNALMKRYGFVQIESGYYSEEFWVIYQNIRH